MCTSRVTLPQCSMVNAILIENLKFFNRNITKVHLFKIYITPLQFSLFAFSSSLFPANLPIICFRDRLCLCIRGFLETHSEVSNSEIPVLCLPSAGTKSICHHTWLASYFLYCLFGVIFFLLKPGIL